MGDAYSDREIADGSYEADMKYMYDNLFTQEPFKTHKDMFNVYYVNVVSMTEGYDYAGAALGGYFGDGTLVGEYEISDLPRVKLVSKMLGKELDDICADLT